MVYFGPSGISDEYVSQKLDIFKVVPKLKELGLTAFEYPFTYGVNLSDEKANALGKLFSEYDINLSVHAPYYINFATPELVNAQKSEEYIIASLNKMKLMGANRLVFHPGSLTKQTREIALKNTLSNLNNLKNVLIDKHLENFYVCPETMGKHGQIGTYAEVAEMCKLYNNFIPTLDFGHINSFTGGSLKTKEDFKKIFDLFINDLKKSEIHIHFSKIKYGEKGELTHLTFEDNEYGPEPEPMLEAIKDYKNVNFYIICESRGTQTQDALTMKKIYDKLLLTN